MNAYQLDFFKQDEECRLESLEKSFALVKESCDKVRKSQFAKIGALTKIICELQDRLNIIEKNICQN